MKNLLKLIISTVIIFAVVRGQNNAVYLDGSGDYLTIPAGETWSFSDEDFTLSFWFTLTDLDNIHNGLFGRNDFQWMAMEYNHDGDRRLTLWMDANGGYYWDMGGLKPDKNDWQADTWYHLAVVRENSTVQIIVDGEVIGETQYTQPLYNPLDVPVFFGRSQLADRFHHGAMDEIRFWSYAMSAAEIQEVMGVELTGTEPGLLGYWNFNESTGLLAQDISGNGNPATLVGDAVFISSEAPVSPDGFSSLFTPVSPTGLPYTIIISSAVIDGLPLMPGAQLGVFDGDLCVGAILYSGESNLQLVAWEGDQSQGLAGFTPGNEMEFRVRTDWFGLMETFTAVPVYSAGDGTFGYGVYSALDLDINTGLAPGIEISATQLNFNTVTVGQSSELSFDITNSGNANLSVVSMGTDENVFTVSPSSLYLIPGETAAVTVVFAPDNNLDYNGNLIISTDIPGLSTLMIPLHGTGLPVSLPQISVMPMFVNFGSVTVGSQASSVITVWNSGADDLVVSGVSVTGAGFSTTDNGGFTLPQGENREISVLFAPEIAGSVSGTLFIGNNDEDVQIVLTGYGSENHFSPVPPSGLPYPVVLNDISVQGFNLQTGDEVAVFDDTLCVGSHVITDGGIALHLDSDDYMEIPNEPQLNMTGGDFTVEFWLRVNGNITNQWNQIFVKGNGSSRNYAMWLNPWSNRIHFRVDPGNQGIDASSTNLTAGTWYHIAGVFRSATGALELYVNGELDSSVNVSMNQSSANSFPLYIGKSPTNLTRDITVDDFRIWNVARLQEDIQGALGGSISGSEANLVGYWNFEAYQAHDQSVFQNDGILYGNPVFELRDDFNVNNILIAWQKDDSQGYAGFTPGNPMSFRIMTNIYGMDVDLPAEAVFIEGDGTFGDGPFSVVSLTADSGFEPDILTTVNNVYTGQVQVGGTSQAYFTVYNTGNVPLVVAFSEDSDVFSVSPGAGEIAASDSLQVTAVFTPDTPGNHTAVLQINSNDPDQPQIPVLLEGFALPAGVPDLGISPGSISFGNVVIDSSEELSFHIINLGTAPLTITDISTADPQFLVDITSFTLVNTNDVIEVTVTFTPSQRGNIAAFFTIYSNAGNYSLTVSGTGIEGHFTQVDPTGIPYNIIIAGTNLNDYLQPGDEVAVFDGDLCVGALQSWGSEGLSLSLDGSGDFVELGNPAALQITGDQTIEMWLYPTSFSARRNPWAKAYGGEGTITLETNGTLNYYYGTNGGNGSPYQGFTMTDPIPLNEWTHLALVRDLSNMTLRWYKNGELVNEAGAQYNNAASGGLPAYIGRGYVNDFAGYIDELRIWSVARSQTEVQEFLNRNLTGNEPGLNAYWDFNGDLVNQVTGQTLGVANGNAALNGPNATAGSGDLQIVAWQQDEELGLPGFVPGNPILFKGWTVINGFDVEIDASPQLITGDGTFGYGQFTVTNLEFYLPEMAVSPQEFFVALEEPDSLERIISVTNTGSEDLYYNMLADFHSGEFQADYYYSPGSGNSPPIGELIYTAFESNIAHNWGGGGPGNGVGTDDFQVIWTGMIYAETQGTYQFRGYSDDGVRLYIDGQIIIDAWYDHGMSNSTGAVDLTAGYHDLEFHYYDNGGGAGVYLYWTPPGQPESLVVPATFADWLQVDVPSDTLAPGQSVDVSLLFRSEGLLDGLYETELTIVNNIPGQSPYLIPVALNVTGNSQISANPGQLDFGSVIVGETHTLSAALENLGTNDLTISELIITEPGNEGNFSITGGSTVPITLPPLGQHEIQVTFQPQSSGIITGDLIAVSDAANNDSLRIALSGEGLTPPDLSFSPAGWSGTLASGSVVNESMVLYNNGQTDLEFTLQHDLPWLSVEPAEGTVGINDSLEIQLSISAIGVFAGAYSGDLMILSNDPDTPEAVFFLELTVTGTPGISSQDVVEFGVVAVGSQEQYPFEIINSGTDTLRVDSVSISSEYFSVSFAREISGFPVSILPGTADTLILVFTPLDNVDYTGILTIYSDAVNESSRQVVLRGTGFEPPDILVEETFIQQTLYSGEESLYPLTISNEGQSALDFQIDLDNPAGTALSLDGDGDYINVVNTPSLNPTAEITIESWVYLNDVSDEIILAKEQFSEGPYRLFVNSQGYFQFTVNSAETVISQTPAQTGVWTHVAAIFDGASLRLLINGQPDNEIITDPFAILPTNQNLRIGRSWDNRFLSGRLDELRLWSVARTVSEIQSMMYQSLLGFEPGLSLYFRFDEDSGNVAEDSSPEGNDGTYLGNSGRVSSGIVLNDFLTVQPLSGQVSPMSSVTVDVGFSGVGFISNIYRNTLHISSNDPDEPLIHVPVQMVLAGEGIISVQPGALDFTDTYVGLTGALLLEITNDGAESITVFDLEFSNDDFSISNPFTVVSPFSSRQVNIFFTPSAPGLRTGELIIHSNASNDPGLIIPLTGTGVEPPVIGLDPVELTAELETQSETVSELTISNTGGSDLTYSILSEAGLSGGMAAAFTGSQSGVIQASESLNSPLFTFEAWVRTDETIEEGGNTVFVRENQWDEILLGLRVWASGTQYGDNAGGFELLADGITSGQIPYDFQPEIWAHVAVVLTVTALQLYIDGTPVFAMYIPAVDYADAGDLIIGDDTADHPFFGLMDEIRIWDTARSQGELNTMKNRKLTLPEPDLVAYITFDTALSGDAYVTDESGTGNDLAVFGGVSFPFSTVPVVSGDGSGLPWLSLGNTVGVVPPGGSVQVPVGFSSAGLTFGTYETGLIVNSNDFSQNMITVPLQLTVNAPVLELSPDSLQFGNVSVESSARLPLQVFNTGNRDLQVAGLVVSNPDFYMDPPFSPFALPAGESVSLDVVFQPTVAGEVTGSITLDTNAGSGVAILTGTGYVPLPDIYVVPSSFNVSGDEGTQLDTLITIFNPGEDTLTYTLTVSPGWVNFQQNTGEVVPGDSVNIVTTFNLAGVLPGEYQGSISIQNNSPEHNPLVVPLVVSVGPEPLMVLSSTQMALSAGQGDWIDTSFVIFNDGAGSLGIQVWEDVSWIIHNAVEDTLSTGDSLVVPFSVNTAGLTGGNYTGEFFIESNDVDSTFTVDLTVMAPGIVLGSNHLSATAMADSSVARQLTVYNAGLTDLEIQVTASLIRSLAKNGQAISADYQLDREKAVFSSQDGIENASNAVRFIHPEGFEPSASRVKKVKSSPVLEGNSPDDVRDLGDLSWLTVNPEMAVISAGDSLNLDFIFSAENITAGTLIQAQIFITHNDEGQQPEPVDLTFYVNNNMPGFTTDDNDNNAGEGIPDDDLDATICSGDANAPIEFNILVTETSIQSAALSVLAFDVDEESGELNQVYVNDVYAGTLSGADNLWSTTVLDLDPAVVMPGWNSVRIQLDAGEGGWCTMVDWSQLLINDGGNIAGIQDVILDSPIGYIPGTTLGIAQVFYSNSPSLLVDVETGILNDAGELVVNRHDAGIIYPDDLNYFNTALTLPAGLPSGTYRLQTILRDDNSQQILDTDLTPFQVGIPVPMVQPPSFNFQNVDAGLDSTTLFTLSNEGDLTLIISASGLDSPFSFTSIPGEIEPLGSEAFSVTFAPQSGGIYQDTLLVQTNGGDLSIPVSGYSEEGIISVEPDGIADTLNFGETAQHTIILRNIGDGNLAWSAAGFDPVWIDLSVTGGVIAPADSQLVMVTLDANLEGGNYQTDLIISSNDVTHPEVNIPVSLTVNGAQLLVSPQSFSVSVNGGETRQEPLSIINTGNGPLTFSLSSDQPWIGFSQDTGVVNPADTAIVQVSFDGNMNAGSYTGNIQLLSNDPDQLQLDIPVSFSVWGATLVTIPSLLSFGEVVIDTTRTLTLTLLNNGNADLTIQQITSVAPFAVSYQPGILLTPGDSYDIQVSFTPAATIFYNELLTILTDTDQFNVSMTGLGMAPVGSWIFSWNHHDFGLTDILTGTQTDLTVTNTGNIQIVVDDWDVSSPYFSVSDTTFVLNVGESRVLQVGFYPDAIAVYNGTINWTSNDVGTAEFIVEGKGFYLSGAPHLTFVDDDLYSGTSGVWPTLGSTSTYFEYQVIYSDPDGNPPMFGYPKVGIDWNGDGDFLDPSEGEISMQEVDPWDFNYADGKRYSFITQLPINQNLGYAFIAYDALGNPAIDEGTAYISGPQISNDLLDISIFANDITFSDMTPDVGQEVIISATVHNNSDYPSGEVSVRFYEEDLFISELFLSGLSPHSQSTVSIQHVFPIDEFYPIKVVIDEDNLIAEDNEYNNFAIRPVLVGEFSIPGAITATAGLSAMVTLPNGTLRFFGHADYLNSFDENSRVTGAQVELTIHETGQTFTAYTNSLGDFNIYFPVPGIVGTYTVSAVITDFTLLTTTEVLSFEVIPYETVDPTYTQVNGPDLYIYWWQLGWSSACAVAGEDIQVTGWFGNGGNEPAEDITVNLYQDGILIDILHYNYLLPGDTQDFAFTVNYSTPGNHNFTVTLDPENIITELNEYNNSAGLGRYIYPQEPDLAPVSSWISDYSPLAGESVNLTWQVSNFNCWSSQSTRAFVYHSYGSTEELIGVLDIQPIAGGSSQYLYIYDFAMQGTGWHRFRIVVDPDDWVTESNEANQELYMDIFVSEPESDLTISDISISNYNPVDGDLLNFTATVWNNGSAPAENFYVEFRMDGVPLGDPVFVESLPSYTNLLVTSDVWVKSDCAHLVEAEVDVTNNVPEPNEFNNVTDRTIGVDFTPSFWPYYWYSSLNIMMGTNLTIFSRIGNQGTFGAEVVPVSWIFKQTPSSSADQLLALDYVSYIPGSGYAPSQVIYQFWEPGDYVIQVVADSVYQDGSRFCEINEHNNSALLYIHVYEQSPDLEILSQHISPTELNPDPDEPIQIYASFTNNGNVPTGPFDVRVLVNSYPLGDLIQIENLGAHEDTTIVATVPYASDLIGTHVIRVRVDENNEVAEYNELNNEASRAIIVGDAPDLTFSDGGGLWISHPFPQVEELVTITGVVENNGGATGTANMNFFIIQGSDTTHIETVAFTAEPYDSLDVAIPWYATTPYGRLYATITDSDPPEFNTFNNDVSLEFGARIQLVSPLPDVQILEDTEEFIAADLDTVFQNIDATQLNYEAVSTVAEVTPVILPGYRLGLIPDADWFGYATINVTATNIYSDAITDSFILYVAPVNDAPVVVLPFDDVTALENTPEITLETNIERHFTDVDPDDRLTLSAGVLDAGLDSLLMISMGGNGQPGSEADSTMLKAYPTPGFTGDIRIRIAATDDSLATAADTLVLTVTPLIYGCTDPEAVNFSETAHLDDGSCEYEISIPLNTGWNWFSLNVLVQDHPLNTSLASIGGNGTTIKSQSQFAQYTDSETGWFGPLWGLDAVSMYMLKMNVGDTLILSGPWATGENTPIPLTQYWNWISYLPQTPMDIEDALSSVVENSATLKNQTGFSQFVPEWGFWFGTLLTLEPHDGFMLRMNAADTLIYPTGGQLASVELRENPQVVSQLSRGSVNWYLEPGAFPYSGTVTCAVEGLPVNGSYLLAAFTSVADDADGTSKCRGMVRGIPSPAGDRILFPVMVYANEPDGDMLNFRLYDESTGTVTLLSGEISFMADMVMGDPLNPIVLTSGLSDSPQNIPGEFALSPGYPNPFNPVLTIPYSVKEETNVRITVYDITGRQVVVLVDGVSEPGYHSVRWNADEATSGIYMIRMSSPGFTAVRKVALVK